MTVIKNTIFSILERFPGRKDDIRQLFRQSEGFQVLCEDYRQCFEALQHWNQSEDEDAPMRRQEYEVLLRELSEEILQNLNGSP